MIRSRSFVVLALLDVPLPGPRPRPRLAGGGGGGPEDEGGLSPADTGVAAPEGLALTSSKWPSPRVAGKH